LVFTASYLTFNIRDNVDIKPSSSLAFLGKAPNRMPQSFEWWTGTWWQAAWLED